MCAVLSPLVARMRSKADRSLSSSKICNLEDFAHPDLMPVIRDVFAHELERFGPDFPRGHEYRKYWEVAMAVRTLIYEAGLGEDAEVLGVGAGHEPTIFHLTRFVRRVFATDLYLEPGAWETQASKSLLIDPVDLWPFEWNPRRLVVQHMDALDLRYDDESFDGVFSSSSIEHFGGPEAVARSLDEMWRVLKPGGVLSLSTEWRIEGPLHGPVDQGTMLFDADDLRALFLGDRPWSLLTPFDDSISPATLATEQPLGAASAHQEADADRFGGLCTFKVTQLRYPHVVLRLGPWLFTSFHLALRKPD